MTRALTALALLLAMSSCDSSTRPTSVLQRFDRMRLELDGITAASERVSMDALTVKNALARANVSRARAAAVRLKRDARPFSRRAGAAGNTVRRLAAAERSKTVRQYLLWVTEVLSQEWIEGVALSALSDLAWRDPLFERGNDAALFTLELKRARTAANRAVGASVAAATILSQASGKFRYIKS